MEIVRQEIEIPTGQERMSCHIARPASGGPYPALVVVMEVFGLNDNIRKLADRFAGEGFVTLAPHLYFRVPGKNVVGYSEMPEAFKLAASLNDDQVVADMGACIDYLKTQKDVKPKFGVVGFCMGGRITFLTACRNSAVDAAVPFYGGGMVTAQAGRKAPIEYVNQLRAPVLAFFGGKDAFIPAADVEKFRSETQRAAKAVEVVLYPDADHGFMCDERPSFHPTHSKQAWGRAVEFFKHNLG
jgi:carboxymethylenebutenolidase